jgi:hypothetical protein
MDALENPPTKGYVTDTLQSLAKGEGQLDATYRLEMERIGRQQSDCPKKILAWLVHTRRPLATQELQHALAVKQSHKSELNEDYFSFEYLRSECAGLVTVDEESNIA